MDLKDDIIKLNDVTAESHFSRSYLGLSQIGEKCHRKLQYDHYWCYTQKISARIQRLFNVGHDAEPSLITALKTIGIEVTDDQKTIEGTAGHWAGHIDGIGHRNGDQFLVEFKTHNERSFNDLLKKKVKVSKPGHYGQMTAYMDGLGFEGGLYVAINKNTSEIYLEWIELDPEYAKELKRKQFEIITADTLLPRIGNNSPAWFECKFCSASEVCFNKEPLANNCRNCQHVNVLDEGKWECDLQKKELSHQEQIDACGKYTKSEMFI
jgi:hypothetical protein